MTDKYGSNPDHDDAGGQDMNETWHGDQPPVDDFADHGVEETATVSEETEMPEEASAAETGQPKGTIIPAVIAGVGGLLLLGALLYWQFGRSEPAPAPTIPPLSTQNNAPTTFPATPQPSVAQAPASSSDGADIANLKPNAPSSANVAPTTALVPVAVSTSTPAMPAPAPTAAAPAGLPPALAAVVAPPVVATPAAPSPVPAAVSAAPTSVPVVKAPVVVVPIAVPASAPVAKDASLDARLNNLSTHVEDLQKSLAQATQQLNQVTNMIAAAPPPSHAAADTNDRLSKIEQQLTQLQHAPALAPPPRSVGEKTAAADTGLVDSMSDSVVATGTKHTAPATRATHHHTTHVTKHAAKPAKHHKTPAQAQNDKTQMLPEPVPVQEHWVLRAATPDEAWLAPNDTSKELRHVRVGDTVPGVGQVKAIHQNGDNWVLEGSTATVQ